MTETATKEYTFRDGRVTAPVLRAMNAVGSVLEAVGVKPSLDPDGLEEAAVKAAGCDDFGGDSYREPLEILTASMDQEAGLSTFGRMATRNMITSQLTSRLELQAWTKAHPQIAEERVERPWIILGLPRTGTSILSHLLGLDPMVRPLLQWETRALVPPPTLANEHTDPRIAESDATMQQLLKLNPAIGAMHPFGAMLAEECIPLMMLDLRCLGMETQGYVPTYGRWLQSCDMRPAYAWHKKALQTLQSAKPTMAWSLKTPNHLWNIETLLEFYPDARLIWTHRDPGPVTASVASLNSTMQGVFARNRDHLRVGEEWLGKLRHAIGRGMAFDAQAEDGWCVHVHYSEMMRDPLATMRRIYAHFGEAPNELHERRITAYLAEKHQTHAGKHVYDPADFGWSYDGLAEIWSDYTGKYGIEREK